MAEEMYGEEAAERQYSKQNLLNENQSTMKTQTE